MPDSLFSDDELSKLKEITELYSLTKTLVFYSEEMDHLETFVPSLNEIKDAQDHLMRVLSVKFGIKEDAPSDYVEINLHKVHSHLYRAAFELLDYIRIYQYDEITKQLEDISNEAIVNAFPSYYSTIKPRIEILFEKIPVYKKEKDIGAPDLSALKGYFEVINEVKEHIKTIKTMKATLIQYDLKKKADEIKKRDEEKSSKRKDYAITFVMLIIAALVGGIVLHYLWPS
jgi:hypothetical protein